MLPEQQPGSKDTPQPPVNNEVEYDNGAGIIFNDDAVLSAGELANNDGSVVETLDTDFHGVPGYIKEHSLAGSNRADYYEARSQGKSDSEEELDVLRKQQNEKE